MGNGAMIGGSSSSSSSSSSAAAGGPLNAYSMLGGANGAGGDLKNKYSPAVNGGQLTKADIELDEQDPDEEYDPFKPNSYDAIVRKRKRRQEEERIKELEAKR